MVLILTAAEYISYWKILNDASLLVQILYTTFYTEI